jgi:circadian clock protein KaiC
LRRIWLKQIKMTPGFGGDEHMESGLLTEAGAGATGPELAKSATGITGLDDITRGGLPRGRVTLVTGSAGAGKTLLGVSFLVAGAREYGEPGVLLTFEESEAKVAANVRSLGFALDDLRKEGLLAVLSFRVDPAEIVTTGDFDLEPLFLALGDVIQRIGAKRVVLDTVEVLFGAFGDETIVRAELSRLVRWLEEQGVTAIVTGERGGQTLTRHGIEEYVSDCVIVLDHRVREGISTRHLRVVKYRGTAHGTNEYPFLISDSGFTVLPVTSVALDYGASDERVSTGIPRLDHMLGGGFFRGATVLVSGAAGTGKTSIGAHLLKGACVRGERALWVLLEESPEQVMRNMRSLGLDIRAPAETGLLHMWAVRPSAFGLETHLAILAQKIDDIKPSVVVIDGILSLAHSASLTEVTSTVTRQLDLLKSRGVTAMITALGHGEETSEVSVSSLVDTWLLLRNVESNGERNRLLFVLKSRGSAHSNQVREFVLTDHGIELVDVYIGAEGVLTGSARMAQQAAARDAAARADSERERHRRELHRNIAEHEAQLLAVQAQLDSERAEMDELDRREHVRATEAAADQAAMASQRWADSNAAGGGLP